MIKINDASVIQQFNDIIPKAAGHAEAYLRTVASGIQEYEPPVTLSLDVMSTGGVRAQEVTCLVVEPTTVRLRRYKTAHYAMPNGGSLRVGWYLVGGERAAGWQIGGLSLGGATEMDVNEVMSIVEVVHTYAVQPAMQRIVDTVSYGRQQSGGFLGV